MVEFEIIKIRDDVPRIDVEVEIKGTKERRHFCYPLNNGWESKIDGEYKFMKDIKRRMENLYPSENQQKAESTLLKGLQAEMNGKQFK